MRQIPRYGIVGSGRLACHMSHYFSLSNTPYSCWSRKHNSSSDLPKFIENSDVIMLLISDHSIECFIEQNVLLKTKKLVHCSGHLEIDGVLSAHPLMSFSHLLFSLETYEDLAFITNDLAEYKRFFPMLKNKCYSIKKELKPYYHALCVLSGNFSVILWSKLLKELESQFNIPKEAAYPYIQSTCVNLMHDDKTALTGPLARMDISTIKRNIEALQHDDALPLYPAFLKFMGIKNAH